jgi:hypothetical protein
VTTRSPACSAARRRACRSYGYTEDPDHPRDRVRPEQPVLARRRCCASTTSRPSREHDELRRAGQLYAGSLQNAQNASTDQFNQGDDALRRRSRTSWRRTRSTPTAANNAYNFECGIALGQSVQNAPSNPLYSPAASAAIDPASVGLKFPLAIPAAELYAGPGHGRS